MAGWRDHILGAFAPGAAHHFLVADADGLLLEEGILDNLRRRGFEIIPYVDPVSFRYAYESGFRSRRDQGREAELIVVWNSETVDPGSIPYDILQGGRRLSFGLADIFPQLSYPVVASLDRSDLDTLYEAQKKYAPGRLGDNATRDFILRHVFGLATEMVKKPKDLLLVLMRRHYRAQMVPDLFDERFIELLKKDGAFADWPLDEIVPDRNAFFSFLQERWPVFLDQTAAREDAGFIRETAPPLILAHQGPIELPFDDQDLRAYVSCLFQERFLRPLPHEAAEVLVKTWVGVGVHVDPVADRRRRLAGLIASLRPAVPAADARFGDWLRFARGWAELNVLRHGPESATDDADERHECIELQGRVDAAFRDWLAVRYAGLVNLPPVPPPMLHHVPGYLARFVQDDRKGKVALVVVDGLSLDQWIIVREELLVREPAWRFRESAVLAWLPTVTSVSRQALFAARPPVLFPDSVGTTDKEPALWKQFWVDRNLPVDAVAYVKGLGGGDPEDVADVVSHPRLRVVGLVIDKIDKIMHGMKLGMAGMHNQVRQWAGQPYLSFLLERLLDGGFLVFLTSDHGNVEARGCGRPGEGSVAISRGERVRVYGDSGLRDLVHRQFPAARAWKPAGLPGGFLPLLAPSRQAFVAAGDNVVTHGGDTVEEVIVPFVAIERASPRVQGWTP